MSCLKKSLEERTQKLTVFPDCRTKRAVFLVWHEADVEADQCCRAVVNSGNEYMTAISLKNPSDAVQELEEAIADGQEKTDAFEIICEKGTYILFVGTIPASLEGFTPPCRCVTEYVRLVDADTWDTPDSGVPAGYQTEWRIKKEDFSAVRALLYQALYSEQLMEPRLREPGRDTHVYGLKCREYSAIREEMCSHYLSLLNRQLTGSGYTQDEVKRRLDMESIFQEVLKTCIHPLWIPITGYDRIVEMINKKCRWKLLRERFSKKPEIETSLTVRQVLSILNGEEDGKPKTEWIREKLVRTELPFLCRKVMNERQQSLKGALAKNFSLYDIRYLLPGKMESFSRESGTEKRDEMIERAEDEIQEILEEQFTVEGLGLDDILRGMSRYYECWKRYIRICMEEACWKAAANLVNEMKTGVVNRYNELKTAKNVLLGSKIKSWEPNLPFDTSGIDLRSEGELLSDIGTYINHQEFDSPHVLQMIEDADSFYGSTDDNHTDIRLHPQIHLICHQELSDGEYDRQNLKFSWIMHPEAYLPKSLLWELRIYTCFDSNRMCSSSEYHERGVCDDSF